MLRRQSRSWSFRPLAGAWERVRRYVLARGGPTDVGRAGHRRREETARRATSVVGCRLFKKRSKKHEVGCRGLGRDKHGPKRLKQNKFGGKRRRVWLRDRFFLFSRKTNWIRDRGWDWLGIGCRASVSSALGAPALLAVRGRPRCPRDPRHMKSLGRAPGARQTSCRDRLGIGNRIGAIVGGRGGGATTRRHQRVGASFLLSKEMVER